MVNKNELWQLNMILRRIKCDNCGHEWTAKTVPNKVYYQCGICRHSQKLDEDK